MGVFRECRLLHCWWGALGQPAQSQAGSLAPGPGSLRASSLGSGLQPSIQPGSSSLLQPLALGAIGANTGVAVFGQVPGKGVCFAWPQCFCLRTECVYIGPRELGSAGLFQSVPGNTDCIHSLVETSLLPGDFKKSVWKKSLVCFNSY